jgi:hypothetical protein
MNERIKELAVQADLLIKKTNGDEFRYGNFDPRFQKFAELIVAECMDVLDPGEHQLIARFQARQWLAEHFGVK